MTRHLRVCLYVHGHVHYSDSKTDNIVPNIIIMAV